MTGGCQVRNQVSGTVSFTVRPHMPTLRSLLLCGRIRGRHLVGTGVEAANFFSTWLTGVRSEISGAAWVRSLSSHGSLMRLQTTGRSSQNFLPGARRERTIRVKYAGILRTRHPCLTPQPCTIRGILPRTSLTLVFYWSNDSKSFVLEGFRLKCLQRTSQIREDFKKHHFWKWHGEEPMCQGWDWKWTGNDQIGDWETERSLLMCPVFPGDCLDALQMPWVEENTSHSFIPLSMHPSDK